MNNILNKIQEDYQSGKSDIATTINKAYCAGFADAKKHECVELKDMHTKHQPKSLGRMIQCEKCGEIL